MNASMAREEHPSVAAAKPPSHLIPVGASAPLSFLRAIILLEIKLSKIHSHSQFHIQIQDKLNHVPVKTVLQHHDGTGILDCF